MKRFPNLNVNATIEIKCQDEKESKVIYDSLLPDNKNFPNNLEMDMQTKESLFHLRLKYISNIENGKDINTLLNTVDEILEHIGIIKDVIKND
jgi:tRNA threonylcarbamoyladenosine modification (KEOPS) complex  Pcc1 subunit